MRKKLLISTIFIFCNLFFSYGQSFDLTKSQEKLGLNDVEFLKAKEGYLKMCSSYDYLSLREATISFADKVGSKIDLNELKTEEDIIRWINENFKLTNFISRDEGCDLVKMVYRLQNKIDIEYNELFDLVKKANINQKREIYKPEFATDIEKQRIRKK